MPRKPAKPAATHPRSRTGRKPSAIVARYKKSGGFRRGAMLDDGSEYPSPDDLPCSPYDRAYRV